MARRQKVDRALSTRLDEFEKRIFVLKIEYEKYFSGIEQIEPTRERDDLRRFLRDLQQEHIVNTVQKHKLRSLKARWGSLEYYWQRNLYQIERGTHPKMKFRTKVRERARAEAKARGQSAPQAEAPARPSANAEDAAYRQVFDRYVEARTKCGQSTDLEFDFVKDTLKKQIRTIKSRYRCKSVTFRVTIEDGKAKVKALPQR